MQAFVADDARGARDEQMRDVAVRNHGATREHRTPSAVLRRIQRGAQLARILDLYAGLSTRQATQHQTTIIGAEGACGGKILFDAAAEQYGGVAAGVGSPVAFGLR